MEPVLEVCTSSHPRWWFAVKSSVFVLTNGGFQRTLKAFCYLSGNQRLCEDGTRIRAPLMDFYPFPPLSAPQSFSHYFQQLLSSRRPERPDRKSVAFWVFPPPATIDFLSLASVYSSGWMEVLQEAGSGAPASGPEGFLRAKMAPLFSSQRRRSLLWCVQNAPAVMETQHPSP